MDLKYVLYEKKEGIGIITLNRPEKLNALTPAMRVEIRQAFEDAEKDDQIRVVILTGAGRAFCAGADIGTVAGGAEMADDEPRRALLLKPVASHRISSFIQSMEKPTLCAVNGIVAGGPIAIALACDILIASEKAQFRLALTRVGLTLENGLSYILPRRIGAHRTLELAYTNDVIDAKEMERIGLANRVVPHDQLMETAIGMARKMFQIPPLSLALAKQCVAKGLAAADLESQVDFERLAGMTLKQTEDQKEAVKSFMEKREPRYQGK